MPAEIKKEIQLEIAHVLFTDIVGYSKLLIDEQHALLETLNHIVRSTQQFRNAEAAGKLIKIPTGDGMALVFQDRLEAPVECALEISRALREHPTLTLRIGMHSGPVSGVIDVNERANVAGAGINMAQRVMDCGDSGHILISRHMAEDLEQYARWQPLLHDLGDCEVKHGAKVSIVNLYTDELGNPQLPEKFKQAATGKEAVAPISESTAKPAGPKWAVIGVVILIIAAVGIGLLILRLKRSPAALTAIPEKSIAVLPFDNLSRDPDNAFFASGIQDEILVRLAKIGALKVISRTSTQQYQSKPGNLSEIGRQLGVSNILEGSVQKAGNAVHINVQLIRAATDEHLWAESYNRKLDDIFGVEGEVATAIAEALNAKVTGNEKQAITAKATNNPVAYAAYLRGVALYRKGASPEGYRSAQQFLEQAVLLDPGFATAWALLVRVDALQFFSGYDVTEARRGATRSALDTALRLQPDLAEVQLAQGYYQYWVERDYNAATRRFEQLLGKWPNNSEILEALGLILRRQGHWDQSKTYLDRAIVLDPLSPAVRQDAVQVRVFTRDFPAALRAIDDALNIWPDDVGLIANKAFVYLQHGELEQAVALLNGLHPRPEDLPAIIAITDQARFRRNYAGAISQLQGLLQREQASESAGFTSSFLNLNLADLRRLSGDASGAKTNYIQARDELLAMLKNQPNNADFYYSLALVYCGLGDREAAMNYAERAVNLMPVSKDALAGAFMETARALVEARFGDRDRAIPALARLLKLPGILTPTFLRLDPDFDLLRGDPRFEKLAASEAPKQ
jgi:TolB-like protein/tetratricopeptide (TPR) repeat protein/class 3 adenylate cyclase